MFRPHQVSDDKWVPVFASDDATELSRSAHASALRPGRSSIAPWESVYTRLTEYQESGDLDLDASPEISALKDELIRMLFGSDPHLFPLISDNFGLRDLLGVRDRMVGLGRIGGKAAGVLQPGGS